MSAFKPRIIRGLPTQLRLSTGLLSFNIAWTFMAGEVSGNVSQVDRAWSILPTLYTALYTFFPLFESVPVNLKAQGVQPRALVMTALQILWSIRLSYNTNRRGLFSLKEEDYRWAVFRAKVPTWLMSLFNFAFIAVFQNLLLFMLGLPAYSPSVNPAPLHSGDALISSLILLAIGGEFVADNQQWAYHNFKKTGTLDSKREWIGARLQFTPADKERGFLAKGLWAYSRHPNCAFEQLVWLLMTLFPFLTTPDLATNPVDIIAVLSPSILLSLLFLASTAFTEKISASKYSAYAAYQQRVGMFWPADTLRKWFWLRIVRGKPMLEQAERSIWGTPSQARKETSKETHKDE
ncbi:hypothetical protein BS47DRAFT_1488996 [Hydnum rufescens UP504]|uniref:DUF1295-domain-containing protein n=1 Tax=Hydnum rufescens UP504 TaxID=1448309 RepID=A0A9P6AK14_9AGAM|nr:hypothetical protein BS47DRAFT_1488996 [Hydnum rufescens UP504]